MRKRKDKNETILEDTDTMKIKVEIVNEIRTFPPRILNFTTSSASTASIRILDIM